MLLGRGTGAPDASGGVQTAPPQLIPLGLDATVLVHASTVVNNEIAFALRGGRGLLSDAWVSDHTEALRLDGLTLVETPDIVKDPVDAEVIASNTRFARNGSLVTSGPLTP